MAKPHIFIASALSLLVSAILFQRPALAQIQIDIPPINYSMAPRHDRVCELQAKLDEGKSTLAYGSQYGYLPDLLRELHISPKSQVLVFSKTSFQRTRISPHNPRAFYFNDDSYVGSVQGGEVLELSSIDPRLGAIFYTLGRQRAEHPAIRRQLDDCLQCHASTMTDNVPGSIVRSVYPSRSGEAILSAGSFRTSYQSPLSERWGGWYVTGTHGAQRHMGNSFLHGSEPEQFNREPGANVTDLNDRFDARGYLSPFSDIVALMVLEHQVFTHNQITASAYQGMFAREEQQVLNKLEGKPAAAPIEGIERRYRSAADSVLKCLRMCGEAKLTGKIDGCSGFADYFSSLGPKDHRGRSLREFDLRTRLFRYPCSYLIYSKAFEGLDEPIKKHIFRRLWEILTGQETAPEFAHLDRADRQAIYEILADTLPGLPDYWGTKRP